MIKFLLDKKAKEIIVESKVTSFTAEELLNYLDGQFPPFCQNILFEKGGQPLNKEETHFAPLYYFLRKDYTIVINSGKTVEVSLNLYQAVNYEGNKNLFTVSNRSMVMSRSSEAPIVREKLFGN